MDEHIAISTNDIAWSSDVGPKFQNMLSVPASKGKDWKDVQWLDMQDEHFIVWMRTSGLPTFRKLWGRLDKNLQPGDYYLKIENNYDVADFQGQKIIVFSTMNSLGGKNDFLAYVYIVVGCVCLFSSIVFLVFVWKNRDSQGYDTT